MRQRKMRLVAVALGLLVGLLALGLVEYLHPLRAYSSVNRGVLLSRDHDGTDYYLYVPTSAREDRPITTLVGLRGIGDQPHDFAASLAPAAEQNGWVLVVPSFLYGDWKKVEALKTDAEKTLPWLDSLLSTLPEEVSLPLRPRALLYGFSRGAQSAHRFAFMYPSRVLGVAAMSAGSYTLPYERSTGADDRTPLEFPMGVGDLPRYCGSRFDKEGIQQVAFWVGVGEGDNSPNDVSHSFDRYIGSTRVERATSFARALEELGVGVRLTVFPRLGHQESAESRSAALAFLKGTEDRP